MPNNNESIALAVPAVDDLLTVLKISETQLQIARNASAQIINVTSRMGDFDEEIRALKAEINEDPRMQRLKEYKKSRKELSKLHQDSVSSYNGIMKVILADAPGRNLSEKIDFAQSKLLV